MRTMTYVDLLLGKKVLSKEGVSIGRIEEFDAEVDGEELIVTAVRLGPPALGDRLSVPGLARAVLRTLRLLKRPRPYRVLWNQIDLTRLDHPRLLCDERELRRAE